MSSRTIHPDNHPEYFSAITDTSIFWNKAFLFFSFFLFLTAPRISAQAVHRVHPDYEDSIRVAIIWNDAIGNCDDQTAPVGEKTMEFVLSALGEYVDHVEVLRNRRSDHTTWADVQGLWGDSLPHVIVHVNAGWSSGWNGDDLDEIFEHAVANKIGIVSIGDDAANLSSETFGFGGVDNVPAPLGDGLSQGIEGDGPIDSLWIGLLRNNDDRLKQYTGDSLMYPGVNGIVSNAIDSIMDSDSQLDFFPPREGRCQADADRYNILYPEWITKLGFQQGHWEGMTRPASDELHVLVAIQDTMPDETIRRAVAVSYQPQFLQDSVASQQITYDAIMFASLAHTLSVASSIQIVAEDTSIYAGDTTTLRAVLIDQFGNPISDENTLSHIIWSILPSSRREGDRLIEATGDTALFTATQAHRTAQIVARFAGEDHELLDTATITILPDSAHHLVIEGSPDGMSSPNADNPIGGDGSLRFASSESARHAWAIIRDRFGNYVQNSQNTLWDTLAPGGIVSADAYEQQTGEGIISKLGPDGNTFVVARSQQYEGALFMDTITVEVDEAGYDSLRVRTYRSGQSFPTDSLVLEAGRDTSLIVQGYRSDLQIWEDVPGSWSLSESLRATPTPPTQQAVWGPFTPINSGSGTIGVEYESLRTSVPVRFLAGNPQQLTLYPQSGSPEGIQPYSPYPSGVADTVAAGAGFEVWAKLFDANGVWLQQYESDQDLASQISWEVSSDEQVEYSTDGAQLILTSTQAYRTIRVTASIMVEGHSMSQTVAVYVTHGTPDHLVIEASATIANMVDDDPVERITILRNQNRRSVFAILRDAWGNFAGYSTATEWHSSDPEIFTADTGQATDVGEGVAQKVTNGTGQMIAEDLGSGLTDTITVTVEDYFYEELRIVNAAGDTVDTLRMNTNQDTTLLVIGRRSDNDHWEPAQARWGSSDNLTIDPTAPLLSRQWRFSPSDTASSGWIRVSKSNEEQTAPYRTWVTFDPGPPTEISLDILTPPENRIAGEPIEASVIIRNEDGEVPGRWCGDVVFDDLLQNGSGGGNTPEPYVIIDGDTVALSEAAEMCFTGGNAVVELVLYDAPEDNLHTVSVFYSDQFTPGGLSDSERLVLLPGAVDRIELVQSDGEPFPGDTVTLDFTDGVTIKSIGYDRYGNTIGEVKVDWETDTTKDNPVPYYSSPYRMSQIYYQVSNVIIESWGIMIASYDDAIDDQLDLHIRPRPAQIIDAITRDSDGNGYLDAIEITFNQRVRFPHDFDLTDIHIGYTDGGAPVEFVVDDISPSPGRSDSVFTIDLVEDPEALGGAPQTAWLPELSIEGFPDLEMEQPLTSRDGAGPVVWGVTREISSDGDRTNDRITVEFSESVLSPGGSPLPFTTSPADLFTAWVDSAGDMREIDLFEEITSLTSVDSRQIQFYMTNGNELTSYNLVSIHGADSLLTDGSEQRNPPVHDNRRTRVIVIGRADRITVGPNPIRPTFDHSFDRLEAQQPYRAFEWAREAGAVIVADIIVPGTDSTRSSPISNYDIKGSMMVFDAIGNLVYQRKGAGDQVVEAISNQNWIPGTTRQLVFYWNGITDQNRAAAPGPYRVIVHLKIDGEEMRLSTNMGIGR
ncbi:MAG: hypothetical protein ACLFSB_00230 [Chitinispirillaceae bacterium]